MLTVETWCEALESGKYPQTKHQLRDEDGFCCLGVLCDLSEQGDWEGYDFYSPALGTASHVPTSDIWEGIGLRTSEGEFEFDSLPRELQKELLSACRNQRPYSLANINDCGGSFPLIAKVIRARPKGLFREEAA